MLMLTVHFRYVSNFHIYTKEWKQVVNALQNFSFLLMGVKCNVSYFKEPFVSIYYCKLDFSQCIKWNKNSLHAASWSRC